MIYSDKSDKGQSGKQEEIDCRRFVVVVVDDEKVVMEMITRTKADNTLVA